MQVNENDFCQYYAVHSVSQWALVMTAAWLVFELLNSGTRQQQQRNSVDNID